jgi:hypothetical protein
MADEPMPPYPYYYTGRAPPRRVDRGLALVLLDYLSIGASRSKRTLDGVEVG